MSNLPESHILGLVHWDLFGHLTLPDNLLDAGPERLGSVVFAWLRRVAVFGKVEFSELPWCARFERGEKGGRLHLHTLISGLPRKAASSKFRFACKNEWERIVVAMARVYQFNDGLPGIAYLLKEGAGYELDKFTGRTDVVIVSRTVVKIVQRLYKRHPVKLTRPSAEFLARFSGPDVGDGSGS